MPNTLSKSFEKEPVVCKASPSTGKWSTSKSSTATETPCISSGSTLLPKPESLGQGQDTNSSFDSGSGSTIGLACKQFSDPIAEQREEGGNLWIDDHLQRKDQRIRELSAEIEHLKFENERLKQQSSVVLAKPQMEWELFLSKWKLRPVRRKVECSTTEKAMAAGINSCQKGSQKVKQWGKRHPKYEDALAKIKTREDKISKLTKLLEITKQIISKYEEQHRKLKNDNAKLKEKNFFLTQSYAQIKRWNRNLYEKMIKHQGRIDKLQSKNKQLLSRERDCKQRLKRTEERLSGWAVSVLNADGSKEGETGAESGPQVESKLEEEMAPDNYIPGFLREAKENCDDPLMRLVNQDDGSGYISIPKLPTCSVLNKIFDSNCQRLSPEHHLPLPDEEEKFLSNDKPVVHKFPRPIDRLPDKRNQPIKSAKTWLSFDPTKKRNRRRRRTRRKRKSSSCPRSSGGLTFSRSTEPEQDDQKIQPPTGYDNSVDNVQSQQIVFLSSNENTNRQK